MGIYFKEEPLLKPFEELTSKEAKLYFDWFLDFIPEAIETIRIGINNYRDNQDWQPDFSEASLKEISEWLFTSTQMIETPMEIIEEQIKNGDFSPYHADSMRKYRFSFSTQTKWMCRCVAIYCGEMLKRSVQGDISWDYKKKPKSYIYLNQPVLCQLDSYKSIFPAFVVIPTSLRKMLTDNNSYGILDIYLRWKLIFLKGDAFINEEIMKLTPPELRKYLK